MLRKSSGSVLGDNVFNLEFSAKMDILIQAH